MGIYILIRKGFQEGLCTDQNMFWIISEIQ